MTPPPAPRSASAIADWLLAYLAKELRVQPQSLDPAAKLTDLGLSSRKLVLLAGDLEDWLGIEVPSDLAWDHPSIASLSAFLGAEGGGTPDPRP